MTYIYLSSWNILSSPIRINLLNHSSRVPYSHTPIWDVFRDNTSSSNCHTIPNSNPGYYNDTTSEPAVFTYPDCFSPFSSA